MVKMIIFSRKTHGFVGETHHSRKPPYIEYDARSLWSFWYNHILNVVQCKYLKIGISPLLFWSVKELSSNFKGEYSTLWENYLRLKCYFATFHGYTWFGCQTPRWETSHLLKTPTSPQICLLLIAARLNAETLEPFRHAFIGVDTETWKKFWRRSRSGYTLSPIIMEVED